MKRIDIKGFLNAYAGSAKAEEINPMAVDAPMTEEMEVDSTETSGNGGFISGLLEANVKLRMLHWNTTSFSAHSALGKAYESLNEQIDDFIETYIGARGRGLLSTVSSLNVSASEDPSAVLD